jgi:hypothetical protein
VAIFGRITARQRLRRAARESLAIPAFSSPIDCTPWVTGGLWPAELSTITAETATLAEYLKADLQRITNNANDQLKILKRAGLADSARQAGEARVIDEARARAVRRVESTIRHLQMVKAGTHPHPQVAERCGGPNVDTTQVIPAVTDDMTQVIPAVTDVEPAADAPTDAAAEPQESTESEHDDAPVVAAVASPVASEDNEPEDSKGRHRARADDNVDEAATAPRPEAIEAMVEIESDSERLQRLLTFVAHQEPRLNWAIGDRSDGTTVLLTDLAHGWIPPGITLPAGVRLLEPERRTGRAAALIGDTTRTVTYAPGDSLRRSADFAATKASAQPRELPPVEDLGWQLSQVTHWRDGLPRMVHTLARAAAAGTGVVDEEIDLLRVHLDTARSGLLRQYPDIGTALLLNCLLLAATEASVAGDSISANYHFAWFQKLDAPPVNRWAANW